MQRALQLLNEPFLNLLQEKIIYSGTFLARTDVLAAKMRLNVEDLTGILGVSRSSLFGWRKGRRKVSPKAWRTLERAERDAEESQSPRESGFEVPREIEGVLCEYEAPYESGNDTGMSLRDEVIYLRLENAELKETLERVRRTINND